MKKIEGPRVEGKFGEQRRIKVSLPKQFGWGCMEDGHRPRDQPRKTSVRGTRPRHVQRQRPNPLMRIRLGQLPIFKHRHRPPAHVVVELPDRPINDLAIGSFPRPAGGQYRLGGSHHEEGPL